MLSDRCLSCLSVTSVYCGQTTGWIKMKLGMELGLDPGHIVLDGDLTPLPQRGTTPNFRPLSGMDGSRYHLVRIYALAQATLCYRVYMGIQLPPKGAHPPIFRSTSIVPKRWPTSAIAEHSLLQGSAKKPICWPRCCHISCHSCNSVKCQPRFSKFFHGHAQQEVCNTVVIGDSTVP